MTEFTYKRLDGKNYTDEDIKTIIKENNIRFIKLQFVDINGQVKNMSVPAQHIDKVLSKEMHYWLKDQAHWSEYISRDHFPFLQREGKKVPSTPLQSHSLSQCSENIQILDKATRYPKSRLQP